MLNSMHLPSSCNPQIFSFENYPIFQMEMDKENFNSNSTVLE
jgi:hypothetical protein